MFMSTYDEMDLHTVMHASMRLCVCKSLNCAECDMHEVLSLVQTVLLPMHKVL